MRRLATAACAALVCAGLTLAPIGAATASETTEPTSATVQDPAQEPAPEATTAPEAAEPEAKTEEAPAPEVPETKAPSEPVASTSPAEETNKDEETNQDESEPKAEAEDEAEAEAAKRTAAASAQATADGTYTDPNDPTVTYTVPTEVEPGDDIVISGTGWRTSAGGGSTIAVLIDARESGDPATVYTRLDVINERTGQVAGDKRHHAVVQAAPNGSWTARIAYPTPENAYYGAQTGSPPIAAWRSGETHQLRFLTGTLGDQDKTRSLSADVTIAGEDTSGPHDPPVWSHVTVEHSSGAVAWVQRDVSTASGSTIRVKGTGWTNRAGTGGSTVALKLNRSADRQYTRHGTEIVDHPSASGDDTIWILLAPGSSGGHPHVRSVGADGTFDITIDAPPGLVAGQYLDVLFQSGRFDTGDVTRAVTSPLLVVGGVSHDEEEQADQATCRTSVRTPTVTIPTPTVVVGGRLRITGAGWCHPGESRGGSRIAIKLDEGAYSHLTSALHQNRTIWAIVEASERDGTFDTTIALPDGTASTSTPQFPQGAHTLRLLTGSLKRADAVRSVESASFTVGAYRPNGTPDPPEASEDLRSSSRGGVSLSVSRTTLTVTVPGARRGDWIYLNVFDGASPTFPWGERWFRADAQGRVKAPRAALDLPAGRHKLSVQSGNSGEVGRLLGWAYLTVEDDPTSTGPGSGGSTPSRVVTAPAASAAAAAETLPPVETIDELTSANRGDVKVEVDDGIATVRVPAREPDSWIAAHLYGADGPLSLGLVQLDAERSFALDVSALALGAYKVAVADPDGSLIGWDELVIEESSAPVPEVRRPAVAAGGAVVRAARGLGVTDTVLIAIATLLVAATAAGCGYATGSSGRVGRRPA